MDWIIATFYIYMYVNIYEAQNSIGCTQPLTIAVLVGWRWEGQVDFTCYIFFVFLYQSWINRKYISTGSKDKGNPKRVTSLQLGLWGTSQGQYCKVLRLSHIDSEFCVALTLWNVLFDGNTDSIHPCSGLSGQHLVYYVVVTNVISSSWTRPWTS